MSKRVLRKEKLPRRRFEIFGVAFAIELVFARSVKALFTLTRLLFFLLWLSQFAFISELESKYFCCFTDLFSEIKLLSRLGGGLILGDNNPLSVLQPVFFSAFVRRRALQIAVVLLSAAGRKVMLGAGFIRAVQF